MQTAAAGFWMLFNGMPCIHPVIVTQKGIAVNREKPCFFEI
jgi:hypothetical protein